MIHCTLQKLSLFHFKEASTKSTRIVLKVLRQFLSPLFSNAICLQSFLLVDPSTNECEKYDPSHLAEAESVPFQTGSMKKHSNSLEGIASIPLFVLFKCYTLAKLYPSISSTKT